MTDHKSIRDSYVDFIKFLYMLKEDLRTKYLGRRGWIKMLEIEDSVGATLKILDNFSRIMKDDINNTKRTRSTEL